MVGGIVIEVCGHPTKTDRLYVDCRDKNDTCAIYVERNATSEKIQIGDSLWWQSRDAMWTPKGARKVADGGKGGVDYDIVIPRIGYSGVSHPWRRWYLDCFTDHDEINKKFPVNTYWHKELDRVLQEVAKIFRNKRSGIRRVSISLESLGQSPMELRDE